MPTELVSHWEIRFASNRNRMPKVSIALGKPQRELGIDEAGRGPVLGPMVLAGVVVPKSKRGILKKWGVSDSKKFGSHAKGKKHRAELADRIERKFVCHIVVIPPHTVDLHVRTGSLNVLEQKTALLIMEKLPADRVVLDGRNVFRPIADERIFAVDKADQTHLCVAAASILAKHVRDREFERLCATYKKEYGDIKGGGYANPATLDFVRWHVKYKGKLPAFYRKSFRWKALSSLCGGTS